MDGCIKFALLTGVTKFGKVSVFSDLNNLDDITMREPYVSLCGITEKENHANFEEEIHELAAAQDMTYEEALARIEAKPYARPFEADPRKLFKIGINFSHKTRNIERWVVG